MKRIFTVLLLQYVFSFSQSENYARITKFKLQIEKPSLFVSLLDEIYFISAAKPINKLNCDLKLVVNVSEIARSTVTCVKRIHIVCYHFFEY